MSDTTAVGIWPRGWRLSRQRWYRDVVLHLSELCVVVSLMGAGLALDRRVSRRGWASTWWSPSPAPGWLGVAVLWGGFGFRRGVRVRRYDPGGGAFPQLPPDSAQLRAARTAADRTGDLPVGRGGGTGPRDRIAIAAFGVRGVGSLFYVSYALAVGPFAAPEALWRVVGLVVVGSIVLHGMSAGPVMRLLDRRRARAAREPHGDANRTDISI